MPIQLFPPGLLGFFQIKNEGRNPASLINQVQPVLEARDWYFQATAEAAITSGTVVAPGLVGVFSLSIPVPNNQYWYVHECRATIGGAGLAAADRVEMAIGFINPTVGLPFFLPAKNLVPGSTRTAAAGDICATYGGGFFVPAGSSIRILITSINVAADRGVDIAARYTRLPI